MGFFDRFASKKPSTPQTPTPSPAPADQEPASTSANPGANVKAQLVAAREKLDAHDLAGAMAIYEELVRSAGDRADVLVTLSGDLGSCGHVQQIVELVAPRYDAERHGPATGINLLQAYLATNNTEAAQHLLDILFSLNRPDLEERLHGFSNALAELLEAQRRGALVRPETPEEAAAASAAAAAGEQGAPKKNFVNLITISKPIWAYGVDTIAGLLPPKGDRLRRVAFAQLALIGEENLGERMKQPEDELGRLSRGLPLWFAETFYFAPHYAPLTAVGMIDKVHYMLFGAEWTIDNVRQLVETSSGIDYVFTGALRHKAGDFELSLKVWEVKKFRERKTFTARWTPGTADAELTKLAETVRMFMEWTAYPAGTGLPFAAAPKPLAHCDSLASSLSLFLVDKGVLPKEHLEPSDVAVSRLAERAATSTIDSLTYLTAVDRAARLGVIAASVADAPLFAAPVVEEARGFLNL